MLDLLNWYLVELDRSLRGRRSAHATAEFLLESRSHLEERIEELTQKGIDRPTAVKAAILDFGDPGSVAQGFRGAAALSNTAYRIGIAIAVILAFAIVPAFCIAMVDLPNIHETPWVSGLIAASWFSFPVMGWLVWRTRKWSTLPVLGLTLGLALLTSLIFTANTGLISLNGENLHVFLPQRQAQIDARADWLRRYDSDYDRLQAWRASDRKSAAADKLLAELAGPELQAPVRAYYRGFIPRILPSDQFGRVPFRSSRDYGEMFRMESHFGVLSAARSVWQMNADDYAVFLKKQQALISSEMVALMNPTPSSFIERWMRHGWQPVAIVGFGSLFALLLNGVILLFGDLAGSVRRYRWRRIVG